ncbi:MAG: anaerobic sulfatase maturase, partial [Actinomycetota bacterium]
MPAERRHFHLLAKPTGAVCNLDCTYCFFLSPDALSPGERLRWRAAVAAASVSLRLAAPPAGRGKVGGRGGEPTLMGVEFFRRALDMAEAAARPGQQI